MTHYPTRNANSFNTKAILTFIFALGLLCVYWNFATLSNSAMIQFTVLSSLQKDDEVSYVQENFQEIHQLDPILTRYVRTRYLSPPSKEPYNFKYPSTQHSTDIGKYVRNFFKDKKNGVFIEAGANEGEFHSHTLDLEESLGWTGLLIECNPTVVPYLKSKRRKAWVAGVCIATTEYPRIVNFSNPEKWSYSGRIGDAWDLPVATNWTYFDVETVPLYNIIAAAGYKEIDFFSFDVEGIEMKILKDFPFDRVKFNLLIVEVYFLKQPQRDELTDLLKRNGMSFVETMGYDNVYVNDAYMEAQKRKR